MNKITRHTITVKGVSHPYSLTNNSDGTTTLICKNARLNQIFTNEDIMETIRLLPEYIKATQEFLIKQDSLIQIRISGREKRAITNRANKEGKTVSAFIRERALA